MPDTFKIETLEDIPRTFKERPEWIEGIGLAAIVIGRGYSGDAQTEGRNAQGVPLLRLI